jgi:hypothetical protein
MVLDQKNTFGDRKQEERCYQQKLETKLFWVDLNENKYFRSSEMIQ